MDTRTSDETQPVVYLAGPMSGCNPAQLKDWRMEVRSAYADELTFIDPCDSIVGEEGSHYDVARADLESIQRCDAVLAYMWRESIGTAHGVIHAKSAGKLVVVVDPNRIQNRTLAFYADAVAHSLHAGVDSLRSLLAAKRAPFEIVKKGGSSEPFDRQKLVDSVRSACKAAGKSDILVPVVVVPKALLQIAAHASDGPVTSTMVREAIWQVLADLETDPLLACDYAGIRSAWERYDRAGKSAKPAAAEDEAVISAEPLALELKSAEHSTIWGMRVHTIADLPERPRAVFQTMCRVAGISRIRLGPFHTGGNVTRCLVKLHSSKTPGIIEGTIQDNGKKGNNQTFQVFVHKERERDAILRSLTTVLFRDGYAKSREFDRP